MKLKKVFAALLATSMLLSLSFATVASAADTEQATEVNTTISITNNASTTGISLENKTFSLYQVFDAKLTGANDDGTYSGVEYTVNDNFIDFFAGLATSTDTSTQALTAAIEDWETISSYLTTAGAETAKMNTSYTDFDYAATSFVNACNEIEGTDGLQTLTALLRVYVITNGTAAAATTSTSGSEAEQVVTSSTIQYAGYYFVLDDDATTSSAGVDVTAGMLVNVTSTTATSIALKGSAPTIEKDVWHNDAESWGDVADYAIGDKVEYLLTATVPSVVTGYETYTYTITDVLPNGVTFDAATFDFVEMSVKNNFIVASDEGLTTAVDTSAIVVSYAYDEELEAYTLTLDFDMIAFKAANTSVSTLYIYYAGVLNENAVVYNDGYEKNSVTLEYSSNPFDSEASNKVEDEVYHYTFDLNVVKTQGDGTTPLEGAVFALFMDDTQLYLSQVDETEVYYIDVANAANASDTAGVITTDATGVFNIIGLDDAVTYTLREVSAPAGYNLAADVVFTINAVKYTADTTTGVPAPDELVVDDNASVTYDSADGSLNVTVVNTSAALLPTTGGMGTTLLTVAGCGIMVAAGVLLIIKRKNEHKHR